MGGDLGRATRPAHGLRKKKAFSGAESKAKAPQDDRRHCSLSRFTLASRENMAPPKTRLEWGLVKEGFLRVLIPRPAQIPCLQPPREMTLVETPSFRGQENQPPQKRMLRKARHLGLI